MDNLVRVDYRELEGWSVYAVRSEDTAALLRWGLASQSVAEGVKADLDVVLEIAYNLGYEQGRKSIFSVGGRRES